MIYEYAIEPEWIIELAKNKKENRLLRKHIIENFGLGKPRLLVELPKMKKWRKLFKEAHVDLSDMDQERLTTLFQLLTLKMIKRDGSYNYDGEIPWLNNALQADQIKPFRAIIARTNPQRKVNVLVGEEIGDWPDDYWKADQQRCIKRNAEALAETLAPLLHNCKKFILIDPYFRADSKKWKEPLKRMLIEFTKDKARRKDFCIEIHIAVSGKTDESNEYIKSSFMDYRFRRILPQNISLKVKQWSEIENRERFHNRYLLTDIGGVGSSAGFAHICGQATTDLYLLTEALYTETHRKFYENPEFELECEFMVG